MLHIGLGQFLHGITPTAMYLAMWVTAVLGIAWRPSVPLYYLIPMFPLETIREKLIPLPLGSHFIEILLFAALLGVMLHTPQPRLPRAGLNRVLLALAVVTFFALIMGSFYLGRPLVLTNADPRFAAWVDYMFMPLTFVAVVGAIRERKQMVVLLVLMALAAAWASRDFMSSMAGRNLDVFQNNLRDSGPLGYAGANGFAVFIAQIEVLALCALFFCKKWRWRLCIAALFGLSLYALVYSFSREAYLGFLAAVIFLGVTRKRILLVGMVALLLAWKAILPQSVQQRISMTYSSDAAAGAIIQPAGGKELDASSEERIQLWKDALGMWEHEPVLGVGFETFAFSAHVAGLHDTHNYYVKALAETGLVGLLVVLWILWAMFRVGWRLSREKGDAFWSGFGIALAACVVCVAVANFFGDRWSYMEVDTFLWALAAFGVRGLLMTHARTDEADHAGDQAGGDARPAVAQGAA